MSPRTYAHRIAALEAVSPLAHAYTLLAVGVPFEAWPDATLEAFCAECPELAGVSDADLELLANPPDAATGRAHWRALGLPERWLEA
jgi:hypothetical protein